MGAPTISSPQATLVTTPSVAALRDISGGFFSALTPAEIKKLVACAELAAFKSGVDVVEQVHRGEHFFVLLEGQVEFLLLLETTGELVNVGTESQPWTPVGWSIFRHPHRYATTVRAKSYSEFLRFSVEKLEQLFGQEPAIAWRFFESIGRNAESLLEEARERLLEMWAGEVAPEPEHQAAPETAAELGGGERLVGLDPTLGGIIPSEESMVTNAAPDVLRVLERSPFFEPMSEQVLQRLSGILRVEYFCRGDVIRKGRDSGVDLLVLADGQVRHEYEGSCGRRIVLPNPCQAGDVMTWARPASIDGGAVKLRATRDGSLLRLPRSALRRLLSQEPELGALFGRRVLWLLSRTLRATRAVLISEGRDRELVAINNTLEQVRTELRVSSELHKVPHLTRSALTMSDAMRVVEKARTSLDPLERHTAEICSELLAPLRKEARFFAGLQSAFEAVVGAPKESSSESVRIQSATSFADVFSQVSYRIEGTHHLPPTPGNIFVFNHLRNHEHHTLPNGFQLTLDSHFISSMILQKTYGDPGIRVVRKSRAVEYGHQDYYGRLGHISVYTPESDQANTSKSDRFEKFRGAASEHLNAGRNLVIAPEGTSRSTEESPGRFKAGAFLLAASLNPEPLIVPIAVANFDRRLGRDTVVATIHEPFFISERVTNPQDPAAMAQFLDDFGLQLRSWVQQASAMSRESGHS
jgi:CRP-like cAMP-binding protein